MLVVEGRRRMSRALRVAASDIWLISVFPVKQTTIRGAGGVPCVNPPMLKSIRLKAQRTAQGFEPCDFVKKKFLFCLQKWVFSERIP